MSTEVAVDVNVPDPTTMPQRVLGKTGELVPILGLGTACGGMGLDDRSAIELFELAVDLGVTYLDTAPAYDRAQKQLSELLRRRRDELFVVTKVNCDGAAEAISILQKNLVDLGTDHVDLTFVHSIGGRDVERVLAIAQNSGVAAMKVYGGATNMKYDTPVVPHLRNHGDHDHQLALRYALDLAGVATAVVGVFNERELRQNIKWARSAAPLSGEERGRLAALGQRLSADWGPHFGAAE